MNKMVFFEFSQAIKLDDGTLSHFISSPTIQDFLTNLQLQRIFGELRYKNGQLLDKRNFVVAIQHFETDSNLNL